MLKKLMMKAAVTLGIAMMAACGGGEQPPETTEGTMTRQPGNGEGSAAAAPARTPGAELPRAQRLDHLLPSPTTRAEAGATKTEKENPAATETTAMAQQEAKEETGNTTETAVTPKAASGSPDIADLVPENPQTNDRVLLQDIYAHIDLEQFALDPNEPNKYIPPAWHTGRNLLPSPMKYPDVHEHPYLHLFPQLQYETLSGKKSKKRFEYVPPTESDGVTLAAYYSGLTYLIYNPWFEHVQYRDGIQTIYADRKGIGAFLGTQTGESYWFGENSTRGVLAETVTKLLEDAKLPSAEPYPRKWWTQKEGKFRKVMDPESIEPRDWTMSEYVRTGTSNTTGQMEDPSEVEYHTAPRITWEFLHPKLPILKITAHAEQVLPLKLREDPPTHRRHNYRTSYSVSFVMSAQNRWTSFKDPGRWAIRFGEDLDMHLGTTPQFVGVGLGKPDYVAERLIRQKPYSIQLERIRKLIDSEDSGVTYPHFWHSTDYMQHRIIGPVVLTVHKSPVLQPGTYSRVPRISHWEAPGHILTDEQLRPPIKTSQLDPFSALFKDPEALVFRYWPLLHTPNAGFPLPGHVMVTPEYGPGTETWEEYGMESWEEYDRSLGER